MSDDPQKDALYAWEDEWGGWNLNTHSLSHCRRLIETACAKYRIHPPKVQKHMTVSLSFSIPTEWVISLQGVGSKPGKGGLNPATAVHEAAHHVVYWIWGERVQDHGPTFLGVYMWLLEACGVAPAEALHASARARGLKWRHMPPTRRETMRARPGADGSARPTPGRSRGST